MRLLSKDPSWITRSARSQSKERAYVVKLGTGVSQWKEPNKQKVPNKHSTVSAPRAIDDEKNERLLPDEFLRQKKSPQNSFADKKSEISRLFATPTSQNENSLLQRPETKNMTRTRSSCALLQKKPIKSDNVNRYPISYGISPNKPEAPPAYERKQLFLSDYQLGMVGELPTDSLRNPCHKIKTGRISSINQKQNSFSKQKEDLRPSHVALISNREACMGTDDQQTSRKRSNDTGSLTGHITIKVRQTSGPGREMRFVDPRRKRSNYESQRVDDRLCPFSPDGSLICNTHNSIIQSKDAHNIMEQYGFEKNPHESNAQTTYSSIKMDGNNAKSQRKIYELGMDAPGKGNKVIRSLWDDIKATSTVSLNTSTVSAMRQSIVINDYGFKPYH